MNKGWIKKHRKIRDHWLYEPNRPRTKLEAWEDLLMDAAFEEREIAPNNTPVVIKVGQVYSSVRFLCKRWKWSIGKVQRFLKTLRKCDMIRVKTDTGMNLISICNYETYQSTDTPTDTETIHQRVQQRYKVKELKEIKNSIATKNIMERKSDFVNECRDSKILSGDQLDAFIDYWSESNKGGKKMKFEMEKTWSVAGRMRTWERRSRSMNNTMVKTPPVKVIKKSKYICPDCNSMKEIEGEPKANDLICGCGDMFIKEWEYNHRKAKKSKREPIKREVSNEEKDFQDTFKNLATKMRMI